MRTITSSPAFALAIALMAVSAVTIFAELGL